MSKYDYFGEYCWVYAIVLADKHHLRYIYAWTNSKSKDINKAKHAVVKIDGSLYDARGKTDIHKIRAEFGNGRLVRFSVKEAEKELEGIDFNSSKLFRGVPSKRIRGSWAQQVVYHGSDKEFDIKDIKVNKNSPQQYYGQGEMNKKKAGIYIGVSKDKYNQIMQSGYIPVVKDTRAEDAGDKVSGLPWKWVFMTHSLEEAINYVGHGGVVLKLKSSVLKDYDKYIENNKRGIWMPESWELSRKKIPSEYIDEVISFKRVKDGSWAQQVVYHGKWSNTETGKDFGGKHFGTKQAAKDRIVDIFAFATPSGDSSMSRLGKPVVGKYILDDAKIFGAEEPIAEGMTTPDKEGNLRNMLKVYEAVPRLNKELGDKGYAGIAYINEIEHPGSVSYLIWDTSIVKEVKKPKPIKLSLPAMHRRHEVRRPRMAWGAAPIWNEAIKAGKVK
jgi:hypothetical protein